MSDLKLAVLGLSDGNGHPYSWSAIFNGYDPLSMADCGFPVIPEYLAERDFPKDAIPGAKVTHVWTQDRALSEKVAKAALIENVMDNYTDCIGQVDGVLLARDDPETHYDMAKPFLEAGLPVYIDKPLSDTVKDADKILDLQQWRGQVFTCSALRYAKELTLTDAQREQLGDIRHVHATVPKSWQKYAVHAIEPALLGLSPQGPITRHQSWVEGAIKTVNLAWADGKQATFQAMEDGAAPIRLTYVGAKGNIALTFADSFSAFKSALEGFLAQVAAKTPLIEEEFVRTVVQVIEYGQRED